MPMRHVSAEPGPQYSGEAIDGGAMKIETTINDPAGMPTQQVSDAAAQALPPLSDALSAQLVQLCNRFSADLFDWLDQAVRNKPREQSVPLKLAAANVAYVLSDRLLYPAYLQRPDLVPRDLQAEI
jgi:hypothetical protein